MIPKHFGIRFWEGFAELLMEIGEQGVQAAMTAEKNLRPRRKKSYKTLRPGTGTPLWNVCRALLRDELRPHGAKVRLARYLGIPKQRISDFLVGRRRMPDAETVLRILHWIAAKRVGKDYAI